MKKLLQLLILLMALYGAYQLYDRLAPPEYPRWSNQHHLVLEVDPPEKSKPPTATQAPLPQDESAEPPPPPRNQVIRIVCSTCDGEGRLTYVDPRGMNRSYACPICNSAGARTLTLEPGQHICPDCRGWGRTEVHAMKRATHGPAEWQRGRETWHRERTQQLSARIRASRCYRCNFTGVITTQKASPGRETPGVQYPHSKR